LRLANFEHRRFVEEIVLDKDLHETKEQLKSIERIIAEKIRELIRETTADRRARSSGLSQLEAELLREYRGLAIPSSLKKRVITALRRDVRVTLNGRGPAPITWSASVLHRFLVFLLWSEKHLTYQQGDVRDVAGEPDSYRVNFQLPGGRGIVREYDDVIVRHGPQPVIGQFISTEVVDALRTRWETSEDLTLQVHWPSTFFETTADAASGSGQPLGAILEHPRDSFWLLYENGVQGVRRGLVGNRLGYIVSLAWDIPEGKKRSELFGEPVIYERVTQELPTPEEVVLPPVLRIGARLGIQGGADKRADEGSTLGCFVITDVGDVGILTTSHGFVSDGGGAVGDRIWLMTDPEQVWVATLRSYVKPLRIPAGTPMSSRVAFNTMDVSLGDVRSNLEYVATFPEQFALPTLTGVSDPSSGDRVFKVGGWSGLTFGKVVATEATVMVSEHGNPFLMRNAFAIEGEGAQNFTREGDSGAVVVRQESPGKCVVLGMIFANDGRLAYAFPIQPALEALHCGLLLLKA
jgi:hypothetical protein